MRTGHHRKMSEIMKMTEDLFSHPQLAPQDVEQFFKLHRALMFFVNQRLKLIPDDRATPEEFAALPPKTRLQVRDAFVQHTDLIQAFVQENPAYLPSDELDIVRSWRHLVHGKFYVFRELKKYTVFLSTGEPPIAYGVLALSQPFEDLIGPHLPVLTQTVLLPFKGQIIYDGLMSSYNISFVVHLQPVVFHPVLDPSTWKTVHLTIGQDLAVKARVQTAAQEGEDVLGGEAQQGML